MNNPDLKSAIGTKVQLQGKAVDAKGGAVVLVMIAGDDLPVYMEGIDFWDERLFGNNVIVEGVLAEKKYIPDPVVGDDGAISQGAEGIQLVLENPLVIDDSR
ncbi:MAG: hypothetical protein ACTSUE_02160 [Promethearchaeota archaeon]